MRTHLFLVLPLVFALACDAKTDVPPNVLPVIEDTAPPPAPDVPAISKDTAEEDVFPLAFRFDSIEIHKLGPQGQDGFFPQLLQLQWANDIDGHKLNILFIAESVDSDAGTAVLSVLSGIGTGDGDQCVESKSITPSVEVEWKDHSFHFDFDLANIYSEDDDGTMFNCSMVPEQANAVPIRGANGVGKVSEDYSGVEGTLLGCLAVAEGNNICTCLESCTGSPHKDCGECPRGSVPLGLMLAGLTPSPECSEVLGEPAYDVEVRFTATRLPHVPEVCP